MDDVNMGEAGNDSTKHKTINTDTLVDTQQRITLDVSTLEKEFALQRAKAKMEDEKSGDVWLQLENSEKRYRAHKPILKRMHYFNVIITNDPYVTKIVVKEIPEHDEGVLYAILQYIYTDKKYYEAPPVPPNTPSLELHAWDALFHLPIHQAADAMSEMPLRAQSQQNFLQTLETAALTNPPSIPLIIEKLYALETNHAKYALRPKTSDVLHHILETNDRMQELVDILHSCSKGEKTAAFVLDVATRSLSSQQPLRLQFRTVCMACGTPYWTYKARVSGKGIIWCPVCPYDVME